MVAILHVPMLEVLPADGLLSIVQFICCSIYLDDLLTLFLKGQDAAAIVATVLDLLVTGVISQAF